MNLSIAASGTSAFAQASNMMDGQVYQFPRNPPLRHESFDRDEQICGCTDTLRVYQIVSGFVRQCHFLADGRRQIMAFHGEGEVFWSRSHTFGALAVEAVCPTTVICFNKREGDLHCHTGPAWLALLHQAAMEQLTQAQEHAAMMCHRNALERVCGFLLAENCRAGSRGVMNLPMSRSDIADYTGLTIETVSRSLTRLEQKGIIRISGQRIIEIVTPSALAMLYR